MHPGLDSSYNQRKERPPAAARRRTEVTMRTRLISHLFLLFVFGCQAQPVVKEVPPEETADRSWLERIEEQYGPDARQRIEAWQELMADRRNAPEPKKLKLVNRFFNRLGFVSDPSHWGQEDYWATPVEFLATNAGDCEDFTVAKYFTLKEMGVDIDRMRLTYVKALKPNPVSQSHMVLAYYEKPTAEPLVLDNLINEIKPASQRQDLVPVYSFNGDGLWLARERGQGRFVGSSSRLSRWTDLLERMRKNAAGRDANILDLGGDDGKEVRQ